MADSDSRSGIISARVVVRVVDYAAARGHDPEDLCRSAGVALSLLRDPDGWVPFALVERLGLRAVELCGDPNIGLHIAQDVRDPSVFDAGVLLMMASPTLGEALTRMERYQRYWAEDKRVQLIPLTDGICVRYTLDTPLGEYQRHSDECALAEIVLGARTLSEQDFTPRIARFRHRAPADTREHAELFRCAIQFASNFTELELDRSALERPLPHANETYRAIFQQQVERALAHLPAASRTSDDVRSAVQAALSSGDCSLAGTARALGISPRTMQRRLRDEGTSFADLIDALRCELATSYLDRQLPVPQIAWLLGYADPSAFHRAFKRWTGQTPEQLRTAESRIS